MSQQAVVVFVEVPDEISDPRNAAHLAIHQELMGRRIDTRGAFGKFRVQVTEVVHLDFATSDGYVKLVPTKRARG